MKNPRTMLWSTSPTNRFKRGESLKKDVALAPVIRRKSKIFKGYTRTIEPPSTYFTSKSHTEAKKGRYVVDLRRQLDKSIMLQTNSNLQQSQMQTSMMGSSID